jgi:hypothetical protein
MQHLLQFAKNYFKNTQQQRAFKGPRTTGI